MGQAVVETTATSSSDSVIDSSRSRRAATRAEELEARRNALDERIGHLEEMQAHSRRLHNSLAATAELKHAKGWSLPADVLSDSLAPLLQSLIVATPSEHAATATRLRLQLVAGLREAGETGHEQ